VNRATAVFVFSWNMDAFIQDVRYAVRLLRKHPLLSLAIVATLALGIGLDAGAFTIVDGVLFRARVKENPASFVQLDPQYSGAGFAPTSGLPYVSLADYAAFRDRASSMQTLAAWLPAHATLSGGPGAVAAVDAVPLLVTCNFFSVYPAVPLAGRVFRDEECAAPGGSPVAVIGEDLWRSRFRGDSTIVGERIELNGRRFTVVGVVPSNYDGQLRGPIWIPYTMQAAFFAGRDLFREPSARWLVMAGRLRSRVSRAAAAAELEVIAQQQDRLAPGRKTAMRLTNGSMFDMMRSPGAALTILPLVMGALSLVLLIACANVTMLLLSRAAARQHEIAVRLSLGATHGRLVRMLLTESLLLAVVAAPASAWIAFEVPLVWKSRMTSLPFYPFQLDLATFGYMVALTFGAGCLAGLAPALEALKSGTTRSLQGEDAFGAGRWRTADMLIVAQVAMSLVLLVGAGLLLRAERSLRTADPGFDGARVLLASPRISVPPHTPASAAVFYRRLASAVTSLPGVASIAFASTPPLGDLENGVDTIALRRPGAAPTYAAELNAVTGRYFETMKIAVVRGRALRDGDEAARVRPMVVSEALARAMWPGGDPIGQLAEDSNGPLDVVGIARDIGAGIGGSSAGALVYVPRAADAIGGALLVRVDGDPLPVARAVRDAIRSLDVDATVEPRTIADIRADLADRVMRIVGVVVFLAAVAIALAVIGLYGVTAFAAGRRTKEMGIRIALGATHRDIVRLVLGSASRSVLVGVAIGLTIAAVASRALQRVFEQSPMDLRSPAAFAVASVLLVVIALTAMFGPAWRAASADPIHALRRD
jgi:predicted permease